MKKHPKVEDHIYLAFITSGDAIYKSTHPCKITAIKNVLDYYNNKTGSRCIEEDVTVYRYEFDSYAN